MKDHTGYDSDLSICPHRVKHGVVKRKKSPRHEFGNGRKMIFVKQIYLSMFLYLSPAGIELPMSPVRENEL